MYTSSGKAGEHYILHRSFAFSSTRPSRSAMCLSVMSSICHCIACCSSLDSLASRCRRPSCKHASSKQCILLVRLADARLTCLYILACRKEELRELPGPILIQQNAEKGGPVESAFALHFSLQFCPVRLAHAARRARARLLHWWTLWKDGVPLG